MHRNSAQLHHRRQSLYQTKPRDVNLALSWPVGYVGFWEDVEAQISDQETRENLARCAQAFRETRHWIASPRSLFAREQAQQG